MHAVIHLLMLLISLQTAAGYSTLISNLCSGIMECTTAQMNLAMNSMCTTAFSTGNDTDTICMGTCRDLFDAIISSCDGTVSQAILLAIFLTVPTYVRITLHGWIKWQSRDTTRMHSGKVIHVIGG